MEQIIQYYNAFDEWGRLDREPIEFIVNLHHILSNLPETGHILDNGAGPGKYAIHLAKLGYDITLTDLTPKLVEIAQAKAEQLKLVEQFQGFHTMNAIDLSLFPDETFDASLMLGPLYHLQSERDRVKAVQELYRVTKPGGVVFVAFMPRTSHLHNSLLYPELLAPNDTIQGIAEFIETGRFDHRDEGRFTGAYYYQIEDIQPFMEQHGFVTKKLISSQSVIGGMQPHQWDY